MHIYMLYWRHTWCNCSCILAWSASMRAAGASCSWSCLSLVPKAQVEMLTIHAWLLFENLSNCVEYKCLQVWVSVCVCVCVQHHKAQQLRLAEPQLLAAWNDKYAIGPKVHDFYMHFSVASAVVLPLATPSPPSLCSAVCNRVSLPCSSCVFC